MIMPQMGESIFEGTITKWLKKPGDTVQQDEPLFEISTDKVDAEIPSPAAGVLSEIKVQAGTTVQINTVVATIGVAGAAPAASKPAARRGSLACAGRRGGNRKRYRRHGIRENGYAPRPWCASIARENNLDLRQVPGTGSAGRITKEDILGYLAKGGAAAPAAPAPKPPVAATGTGAGARAAKPAAPPVAASGHARG